MKKKSKNNRYKTKDFVLLGILTAIYFVLYFALGATTAALNPLLHAFSPAIFSLFAGTIILFLISQIPKFGILTLQNILVHALFGTVGMGYLPWFLISILGSVLADVIAYSSQYKNTLKNATAYGIFQTASVAGGVIPAIFFAESYKKEWMSRGVSAEQMDATIAVSVGWIGAIILLITFLASVTGIYIGRKILAKHFRE